MENDDDDDDEMNNAHLRVKKWRSVQSIVFLLA